MMKVWVLTSMFNDYDQHGEYLVGVFSNKPTREELANCGVMMTQFDKVLKHGGGRVGIEDEWFYLKETALPYILETE